MSLLILLTNSWVLNNFGRFVRIKAKHFTITRDGAHGQTCLTQGRCFMHSYYCYYYYHTLRRMNMYVLRFWTFQIRLLTYTIMPQINIRHTVQRLLLRPHTATRHTFWNNRPREDSHRIPSQEDVFVLFCFNYLFIYFFLVCFVYKMYR